MTAVNQQMKLAITIKPGNPDLFVQIRDEEGYLTKQSEFEFEAILPAENFNERAVNLLRRFSIELKPTAAERISVNPLIQNVDTRLKELINQANAPLRQLVAVLALTNGVVDFEINNADGIFSVKIEKVPEMTAEITIKGFDGVWFYERGMSGGASATLNKVLSCEEGMSIHQTVAHWLTSVLCAFKKPGSYYARSIMRRLEKARSELSEFAITLLEKPDIESRTIRSELAEIQVIFHAPSKKDDLERITKDYIESQIERVDYFTAGDAIKDIPNGDHVLYCLITMKNGHQETAYAIAGNRSTFDPTRGRAAAYQKAIGQLFPKFYFLQSQLSK